MPACHAGGRGFEPLPGRHFLSHLGDAGVAQLAEQLICNQQVAGSSPFTSSFPRLSGVDHYNLFMGRFPSGQREQTVNLPSPTSVVRIHPCPPSHAGMAELADAHDSGSCVRTYLQVQVLFPARWSPCKSTVSAFVLAEIRLPYAYRTPTRFFTELR